MACEGYALRDACKEALQIFLLFGGKGRIGDRLGCHAESPRRSWLRPKWMP